MIMVKYENPEIKIIQNGVNKKDKSTFINKQTSKIFNINQTLFLYLSDIINNSSKSIFVGTMSLSLWCVLKLLNASKYIEHITGAEYDRYERNTKTKSYKIDGNTIKVYGENVPIKEGKVREIRNSIENKKFDNNNEENNEMNNTKITINSNTTNLLESEYQGTKELQEIVNSLRQILERKAPIDDDELNEVMARLNGNSTIITN